MVQNLVDFIITLFITFCPEHILNNAIIDKSFGTIFKHHTIIIKFKINDNIFNYFMQYEIDF